MFFCFQNANTKKKKKKTIQTKIVNNKYDVQIEMQRNTTKETEIVEKKTEIFKPIQILLRTAQQ